jgi:hypothetical protein
MLSRMKYVGQMLLALALYSTSATAQTAKVIAGMGKGGPIVGGDYELPDTATESYGLFGRLHSKDRDNGAAGIIAFGGFFKIKALQGPYEFFMSPGLAIMSHDLNDTELLIGPSLSYGFSASLDSQLSVGVTNQKLYSWLGEYKGLIDDSLLVHVSYVLQ